MYCDSNNCGHLVQVILRTVALVFSSSIKNESHLQRSYSPDVFSMVLSRLTTNNIVPVNEIERLKNLADMTERIWKQKAQNEKDFGDDVPDDFRGSWKALSGSKLAFHFIRDLLISILYRSLTFSYRMT